MMTQLSGSNAYSAGTMQDQDRNAEIWTPALGAAARTGVLLIAHGSRRQTANDDLVRLRQALLERAAAALVEIAYLELVEPTIPDGAAVCIDRGATRVLMLPYFLSAGAHVVEDLEEHRRTLAARYPDAQFVLCPPLGLHPLVVDIVLHRLAEGDREARSGPAEAGQHKREGEHDAG
jgi:sirohydrochlorin ferrochelatase